VIDERIFEFPISYTNLIGQTAIGWGAHKTVADECKAVGMKKALITTTGLKGTGIVDEIIGILHHGGVSTILYDKVTSNPKDHEVMEAYEIFKAEQCDGVVSVGGGSSHDCGKGVRAVFANDGKFVGDMVAAIDPPWMESMKSLKPANLPQISVNTTAGTGAETTFAAAIVNTTTKAKLLTVLPGLGPNMAITDPLLVRTMPPNIIAQTGFDALAHAFESFIARMPSHYNRALQLEAMKTIYQNIREFTYHRMNTRACENMCWASSVSAIGMVFGGSVGIVHGMSHGLSVLYGVHHGLASATVALAGERYNQPVCHDKFGEMARAFGVDTTGMTRTQASDAWFDEIERLLDDLGIESGNLNRQFGFRKEDAEHIIKWQYDNDFAREGNPRDYDYDECVRLLQSLY
jgi:alcohol dehydrogenase class IV